MSSVYLSVVAPCYNEEEGISELVKRVCDAGSKITADFELVVVNDGSKDQTLSILLSLRKLYRQLVIVDLSRNFGHQNALSAGLAECRGERILIIDCDLQDPPELLLEMNQLMDQGYEIVYGRRLSRKSETFIKKATASLFYRLLNYLSDIDIPKDAGDFRLISKRVKDVLLSMPEKQRFVRGMVAWIGFKQIAFDYHRDARYAGETKYPFRKMVHFAITGITSFSMKPLQLISLAGITISLISGLLLLYFLVEAIVSDTAPGWASLMVVMLGLGGVQLLAIGVLGDYLGKAFVQMKGRPIFLIDKVYRDE